ncbi:MAG: hypothetical protein AB4372_08270 [Xenococcus sp. (in: cyanobacteria)]
MTTKNEARKAMAESRQHEEHIQDNILSRSEEEIKQSPSQEIAEESRELMVEKRQQEKHTKETMLSRAEAEIGQIEK